MNIVILGLSITSSWGNGHATTYRALVRALAGRGHSVLFLERDVEWYASHRDLPRPPYCDLTLYGSLAELETAHAAALRAADLVVVGSYVPEGIAAGDIALRLATGTTAFYDIDTPVTLAQLRGGDAEYIARRQVPRYDLYLSFSGGRALTELHKAFGARMPRPLYCSVDPELYFPEPGTPAAWDCGYLGTYSDDRQPVLERLLLTAARDWPEGRFVVAGPQYPADVAWPANVARIEHLPPSDHRRFYNSMRYTLNVTRRDMVQAGHSPSVRLFEAAACGVPIISDEWTGLSEFFVPAVDILLSSGRRDTLRYLREMPEADRLEIGQRGRQRVMKDHTAAHRAAELEEYVREAGQPPRADGRRGMEESEKRRLASLP